MVKSPPGSVSGQCTAGLALILPCALGPNVNFIFNKRSDRPAGRFGWLSASSSLRG